MHVTLNKKCTMLLNKNIFEKLGSPKLVVMLFDKANSIIGLNPVGPGVPHAFKLAPICKGLGRHIFLSPFCRHYGIRPDRTLSFVNPEIDDDGVLRLNLNSTTPARNRRSLPRHRQN